MDLDRVLAQLPTVSASQSAYVGPTIPQAATLTMVQPALSSTVNTDRMIERLKRAQKLIADSRHTSIESLYRLLRDVYLTEANNEIAKMRVEEDPRASGEFDAVYLQIRQIFLNYAEARGPLLAQLNVLAGTAKNKGTPDAEGYTVTDLHVPSLQPAPIPVEATPVERVMIGLANEVRARIRAIDAEYEAQADALEMKVRRAIDQRLAELERRASETRAAKEHEALEVARSQVSETQVSIDTEVKRLVPPALPAVPAKQVVVPAAAPVPSPPVNRAPAIFGSLEQRRHLLDQQVDLWVKTTGRKRSSGPSRALDATDEFLRWRRANDVGP